MAKVTLWTRQDMRFLDVIQKEGLFQVKREYIQEKNQELTAYFIKLYDWFTQEASKRVPLPEGAHYPIWCSVSEEYMLRGAHGNVLVQLCIDEDRVVYFDSPKWDLVLNHTYVAKDREDQMAFEADLKRRGLENGFALLDEHHSKFYPDLRKKVMDSWVNIFDFDPDKVDPFSLQANIWEIRPEDIVQILEGEEEQPIKIMGLLSQLKP